jgi:hypothetical protein
MVLDPAKSPPPSKARAIVQRTRGRTHGPATRLMSPSDLGEILKPFVFLDLFDHEGAPFKGGLHPHSGIATLTYVAEGAVSYIDPDNVKGTLPAGGVEWMQAGRGMWHGGGLDKAGRTRGFQLWIALPPELELGPTISIWSTRITELRTIMPTSARSPRWQQSRAAFRDKQCSHHPDQSKGRDAQHQKQPAEALKLNHQHNKHDEKCCRNDRNAGRRRFSAFLNCPTGHNHISNRQLGIQHQDLRVQGINHCCRQHVCNQIALDSHCWISIPSPDQWPILSIFDRRQLK